MLERGGHSPESNPSNGSLMSKAKRFASQLAEWDDHLIEVFALGEFGEDIPERDTLTLICTFDPEPANDAVGFYWVVNLLVRSKYEALKEDIGLEHPIDLGLRMGENVFLPGGSVLRLPDDPPILWPDHGE